MHGRSYALMVAILALHTLVGSSEAGATTIAAGSNFTVALQSNGSLWAWGNNSSGQLGNGTYTSATSPAQVGTGTTWSAVAAGSDFVVALTSDGTLWAWGDNSSGQLGNRTTTGESAPVQIMSGFKVPPTATSTTVPTSVATRGSSSHCFVATAAYGSPLDRHVAALRAFRDTCLLTNRAGRSFVAFYYRYSPPLAHLISRDPSLRTMTRWALTPLVYGVMHPFVFVLIPPLFFFMIYLEKGRRGRKIRKR